MPSTAEKEYYSSGFPKKMNRTKFNLPINHKLREARNKRGYSLKKVVSMLKDRGIDTGVSTIQGYEVDEENMNHRYPSLHMLMTLMDLYDCSADFIFDRTEEIEIASHDVYKELRKAKTANWKGRQISDGQRSLLIEKFEEIMTI